MRIELFGGFRATRGGHTVTRLRTQKAGVLLAYLACHLDRFHPREILMSLLWPEADRATGRQRLNDALSAIRTQFRMSGDDGDGLLLGDRFAVRLNSEKVETDVGDFERAIGAAEAAKEPTERVHRLLRAVDFYRGELLPGYYEDWVVREQDRLNEMHHRALRQMVALFEASGDLPQAVRFARRLAKAPPLSEEAYRDLIRLHIASGEYAAALQDFQTLEHSLEGEGIRPSPVTLALREEIERVSVTALPPSRRTPPKPSASVGAAESISESLPPPDSPPLDFSGGEYRPVTALCVGRKRFEGGSPPLPLEEEAAQSDRLLKQMVRIAARYDGYVERYMGDRILVVFGSSQVHEDDPERALRVALEIREAARVIGVPVTAGIETGEAYVGRESAASPVVRVESPAIRIAERLQDLSDPNLILAGETVIGLTRGAFLSSPLPWVNPGYPYMPPARSVEGVTDPSEESREGDGLSAPFIGREEELSRLREGLEKVLLGQGQIVTLVGEAGIGKSRLFTEFKKSALSSGGDVRPFLWLEGRGGEWSAPVGFSLLRDLLRRFFSGGTVTGQAGDRITAFFRSWSARGVLTPEQAKEMGSLFDRLLSNPSEDDGEGGLRAMRPEQVRHRTLLAVQQFFATLANQQPVVLVLDDLHWADRQSLDALSLLAEEVTRRPLLMICVYRPEEADGCRRLSTLALQKFPERYREIVLRKLNPEESRALLEGLLGGEGLPAPVRGLAEGTDGNPFFMEEVVRSLLQQGALHRERDGWRAEALEAIQVPRSVRSVILSRIDRLGPGLKRLLQKAAVVGQSFPRDLLERVATEDSPPEETNGPDGDLERGLAELERQGFIYRESILPEERYAFKHVLIRETVYEGILNRLRAGLHLRAAEAVESLYGPDPGGLYEHCEGLARHYSLGGHAEKAAGYLLESAEKAKRIYANQEAVGYAEQALGFAALLPEKRRRDVELKARAMLGELHFSAGAHREAEAQFERARSLISERGDPGPAAALSCKYADSVHWQGRYDEAVKAAESALAELDASAPFAESDHLAERADLLEVMMRSSWARGDWERAEQHAGALREILPRLGYYDGIYTLYYALAWLDMTFCRYEDAARWLDEMEKVCGEHGNEVGLARCIHGKADLYRAMGEPPLAIDHFRKSLVLCERTGDAHLLLEGHLELAHLLMVQGEVAHQFEPHIEQGMKRARDSAADRPVSTMPILCEMLSGAYMERGEKKKALTLLLSAFEFGSPPAPARLLSKIEQIYTETGRPDAFRQICRRLRNPSDPSRKIDLEYWYLQDAEPSGECHRLSWSDSLSGPGLSEGWRWVSPGGEGEGYHFKERAIELYASGGRSIHLNCGAPRLLHPASGDFAAEVAMTGLSPSERQTGGLILASSEKDFVILGKSSLNINDLRLEIFRDGVPRVVGRGWLPGSTLWLRIERHGTRITALCGNEPGRWHLCGEVTLEAADPLKVGLYVTCPPSFPSSLIRFRDFKLFRPTA